MSEQIKYYIEVKGFKKENDLDEFVEFAKDFMDGYDFDVAKDYKTVWLNYSDGWRGSSLSCKQILKGFFEEYFEKRKYLSFKAFATYLEQVPTKLEYESEVKDE